MSCHLPPLTVAHGATAHTDEPSLAGRRRPGGRLAPLRLALALAGAGVCVSALGFGTDARAQAAATVQADVPAGPLAEALGRFALQAGVTMVVDADKLAGLRSEALRGPVGVEEGLRRLLRGSGYDISRVAGGYVLVTAPRPDAAPPAAPVPQAAARSGPDATLPAVRVVSTRPAESAPTRFRLQGAPAPIEPGLVTAQSLERLSADDLEDVFASQPEVVVGGGHAIAQKVYVRGFEDTMLNVTIDGAAQAGQTFHHTGRVQIEPELLKRVEVMAGTGDATAGPGALGGSIRFVTKDPLDLLRPGEQAGGLVKLGYTSNGEGYKAHGTVFGRWSPVWSAMASFTQQDQNDFSDGSGERVVGTRADQRLGFFKITGHFDAGHTLRLSHDAHRDKGLRTQRPQWVVSGFNRAYPLQSERRAWTLGYDYQPDDPLIDLRLTVYDTRQDLKQDVIGRWGLFSGRVDSTGADVRNTSRWDRHTLTYGLDHRKDRTSSGYGSEPGEFNDRGTVWGIDAQDSIAVAPTVQLHLGVRYDRYRLVDVHGRTQTASGSSPNASVRWSVLHDLDLVAGHARALRGPKVRDAFKQDSMAANAPELQPERARTTDVGFEYSPGTWRFNAKAYRTTVRDAIADPIGRPNQFENVGKLESRGVLLHASHDWRTVRLGVGYHHNTATLDGRRLNGYEHNALGTSQGDTLTGSVTWALSEQLELGWTGRLVRAIGRLDTSVGAVRKPGYGVHDVHLSWTPRRVLRAGDVTVSVAVKNLLDKDYLDHGSNEDFQHIPDYEGIVGSREPGRELRLSVALRF